MKRALPLWFLFACAPRAIDVSKNGVTIAPWLTSAQAVKSEDKARKGAAYAPFAAAKIQKRSVEALYGAFRFEEIVQAYAALEPKVTKSTRDEVEFTIGEGRGRVSEDAAGDVIIDWTSPGADRVAMSFRCEDGERFFGLGAQVSVEHTGRRVPIWVSEQGIGKTDYPEQPALLGFTGAHYDSYAPIPFTVSTAHRGFFVDTPARSELELCEQGALRIESDGEHFRLRVTRGPSMRAVLAKLTALTGTPPELPPWTFAPWVDVFGGPAAIRAAAADLRAMGTPASAIWSEDWVGVVETPFGENLSYNWEADTKRFPDLARLTSELHAQGFRFLAYMNPYLADGTRAFAEARSRGLVVSDATDSPLRISFLFGAPLYLFDASTAEGASFYADYAAAALAAGVDGWMADYGEALPYEALLDDGTSGALSHNAYPLMWAKANFAAMQRARPSGDFVTFNRSGSAGIAAHTSVHWLGDQLTSFDRNDGLGSVMPLYLSAGMSGIALTHSDIGGYTSDGSSLIRDDELWTRWLELEAFTPVMRTHHTSSPAKNVQWNSSPQNRARFDRFARWHQRLLPYFSQLAAEAHESGAPAVRPIWWTSEAPEHFAVDQEALVGDDLLLAPIVERSASSRAVVFPDGGWRRWRDFGAALDAPNSGEAIADAGLEDAVVYVRAGAVLPLLAEDVPSVGMTMPAIMLLAVSGGDSEGGFAGVRWTFHAPDLLPSRAVLHVDRSGEYTVGTAVLSIETDRPIVVRVE